MADPKGVKAKTPINSAGVDTQNTINMAMEDLTEEDRRVVECELEEEMVERSQRKLVCFQKTRNGVIRKGDTVTTSGMRVDSLLSPEDLIHLVDVFVTSKYGADLMQFTRVMGECMHNTFDSLKQELNASLPRQVRALVQQINDEVQGKWVEGSPAAPSPSTPASHGNQGTLANVNQPAHGGGLNVHQPFYQTIAYGPNIPPMGNGCRMGRCLKFFFQELRVARCIRRGWNGLMRGLWQRALGSRSLEH
jgi:hypothetical protein